MTKLLMAASVLALVAGAANAQTLAVGGGVAGGAGITGVGVTSHGLGFARGGAAQATTFIDEVITEAPDVVVQIAHFAGGGSPDDPPADEALGVFVAAIARADPRVRNLYFDTALIAPATVTPARAGFVAQKIREMGTKRILYGSDGGDPTDPPAKDMLAAFRKLPLTAAEFKAIESNVAPYLK